MSTLASPISAMALDLALALDPAMVMVAAGLSPDSWQQELLRTRPQRSMLLCSRQVGKSTTTAAVAVDEAIQHAPALILLLSPTQRQSYELLRKVIAFYESIGAPVPIKDQSLLRLELANGSRIIALPENPKGIRGFSGPSLLIVDEAAQVSDELYFAAQPMLATSNGRIILLSTPFGKRGFFHQEWHSADSSWHRVKVTAYECSRIPAAFLEQARASVGNWFYEQEYECEWKDTIDSAFSYEHVMAACSNDIQPLQLDGIGRFQGL